MAEIIVQDPIGGSSSTVRSGGTNDAQGVCSTVFGGLSNKILTTVLPSNVLGSTIIGGQKNLIENPSCFSTIFGGQCNIANQSSSSIGGGVENIITNSNSQGSFIGGGCLNKINSSNSVIGGGDRSCTSNEGNLSTIFGGRHNQNFSDGTTIIGGQYNWNFKLATNSTISGGYYNCTLNPFSSIGGGLGNTSISDNGFIGGGFKNCLLTSTGSTIFGGSGNLTNNNNSTIFGGVSNETNLNSAIGGGCVNRIDGTNSVIGGGQRNFISTSDYETILGGSFNQINNPGIGTSLTGSTILGGTNNLISKTENSGIVGSKNSISSVLNGFVVSSASTLSNSRSVLLGGENLISLSDDTTHVPFLNINDLRATPSIYNLGIDADGLVVPGLNPNSPDLIAAQGKSNPLIPIISNAQNISYSNILQGQVIWSLETYDDWLSSGIVDSYNQDSGVWTCPETGLYNISYSISLKQCSDTPFLATGNTLFTTTAPCDNQGLGWDLSNPYSNTGYTFSCPSGFLPTLDNQLCYNEEISLATYLEPQPISFSSVTNTLYGSKGVRIFKPNQWNSCGFPILAGTGSYDFSVNCTTNPAACSVGGSAYFWTQRLNSIGIWFDGNNQWPGPNGTYPRTLCSCETINSPITKIYYIGLGGDDKFSLKVNGNLIIDNCNTPGGTGIADATTGSFVAWNIYPIVLNAGENLIEFCNTNVGGTGSFAYEVYDMTVADLISVTASTQLNVIRSSGDFLQGGSRQGSNFCSEWVCPTGFSFELTNGSPICRKITYTAATVTTESLTTIDTIGMLSAGITNLDATKIYVGSHTTPGSFQREAYLAGGQVNVVLNQGEKLCLRLNNTTGINYVWHQSSSDWTSMTIQKVKSITPSVTPTPTPTPTPVSSPLCLNGCFVFMCSGNIIRYYDVVSNTYVTLNSYFTGVIPFASDIAHTDNKIFLLEALSNGNDKIYEYSYNPCPFSAVLTRIITLPTNVGYGLTAIDDLTLVGSEDPTFIFNPNFIEIDITNTIASITYLFPLETGRWVNTDLMYTTTPQPKLIVGYGNGTPTNGSNQNWITQYDYATGFIEYDTNVGNGPLAFFTQAGQIYFTNAASGNIFTLGLTSPYSINFVQNIGLQNVNGMSSIPKCNDVSLIYVPPTPTPTVTPTLTPTVTPTLTPTVTPTVTPTSSSLPPTIEYFQSCCNSLIYKIGSIPGFVTITPGDVYYIETDVFTGCTTAVLSSIFDFQGNYISISGHTDCATCITLESYVCPTPTPTPTPTLTPTPTPALLPDPLYCFSAGRLPQLNNSVTYNGVTITASGSGDVGSFAFSGQYGCNPIVGGNSSANTVLLGGAAFSSGFTYTLSFSTPVNNVVIRLFGYDACLFVPPGQPFCNGGQTAPYAESFTLTTNGGGTQTITASANNMNIVGNTLTVSTATPNPCTYGAGQYNYGSGGFEISSTLPYTTLTISGPGGLGGTLVDICADSLVQDTDGCCGSLISLPNNGQSIVYQANPNITISALGFGSFAYTYCNGSSTILPAPNQCGYPSACLNDSDSGLTVLNNLMLAPQPSYGQTITYTLNFNIPINNVKLALYSYSWHIINNIFYAESFSFTTNTGSGIPTISSCSFCCASISGNTITAAATGNCANGNNTTSGDGSGIFTITNSQPFTSLTITIPNWGNGKPNPNQASITGFLICSSTFEQQIDCVNCNLPANLPLPNQTTTYTNGMSITGSGTGSITLFAPGGYSNCGLTSLNNTLYVGLNGPFTYTMTFSTPVNDIGIRFHGFNFSPFAPLNPETFTLTTNTGDNTPYLLLCNGCNVFTSGNTIVANGDWNNIGSAFYTVHNQQPFTTLTISGPGGPGGTYVDICQDSLPPLPTPTPTPTPTSAPISQACSTVGILPQVGTSVVYNGVVITATGSGSISFSPSGTASTSCPLSPSTLSNSVMLGFNLPTPFTYTLNFSVPVNNIQLRLVNYSARNLSTQAVESFTFVTNAGTPTISSPQFCNATITGNVIAAILPPPNSVLNSSGRFIISNATPYVSITITGPGGLAGTIFEVCSNSVVPAQIVTPTPTPTPSTTPSAQLGCIYQIGVIGDLKSYNITTNTLTNVIIPNDTFSNFPAALTQTRLWKIQQNSTNTINEWVIGTSPNTLTFNRQINVSFTFPFLSDAITGAVAIDNNTLVVGGYNNLGIEYLYRLDITTNNVGAGQITQLFALPGDLGIANMIYTQNNKLLMIRNNVTTQENFLQQYDYTTGTQEFNISLISLGTPSAGLRYNVISEGNIIYVVRLSGPSTQIYSVNFNVPYTFTLIYSSVGTSQGVWISSTNCSPIAPAPTPTPTPTPFGGKSIYLSFNTKTC